MKKYFLTNGESGIAMIMALIMLALGSLIIVPTLSLAGTNLEYHQVVERNTLETYAADAGVQYALCELGNDSGAFGPETLPSAVNGKTVNVAVEDMGNNIYKITSTATTDSGSSTTIESYVSLRPYAIVSTDTEAKLTCRQRVVVNGDIYCAGELEIIDDAIINGEIIEGDPFDIGIDPEEYKTEAQSGGTHNGNLIINSSPYILGPLYITGKLKIEHGVNVILGGTVYVEKNITVKDDVIITGTGNLLCANQSDAGKSIEIHRRVTISLENIPLIMVVSSTKEVKIGDECDITGVIYVPNGMVHVHAEGPSYVYGALIGKGVRVCEDTVVTLAPDLGRLAPYALRILTWQVN